jgi:hypothetical protein
MTRRAILFAVAALRLRGADAAAQVWDVLTGMASALSTGDAPGFLHAFDPQMKGYEDLATAVTGLVAETEVESGIDPVSNTGDDQNRTIEVSWSLRLISRSELHTVTQREAKVTIRLARQRGNWKVVAFEPADLLRAPSARV